MSLARLTASASLANGMTTTTGPKISSRAIRMALLAPSRMVGSTLIRPSWREPVFPLVDPGAFPDAEDDIAEHPLHVALLDQRAELRAGIERMAERDLGLLHRGDLLDQRLADRGVGQHPRARMAGLALIVIDAPGDRGRRGVEIGVEHHDMGRLAAAFERDPLHVALPGVDEHQLADLGRAGEGDHVDVGMERERLAGPFAEGPEPH